jgi:hypothetical protein
MAAMLALLQPSVKQYGFVNRSFCASCTIHVYDARNAVHAMHVPHDDDDCAAGAALTLKASLQATCMRHEESCRLDSALEAQGATAPACKLPF